MNTPFSNYDSEAIFYYIWISSPTIMAAVGGSQIFHGLLKYMFNWLALMLFDNKNKDIKNACHFQS